MHSLSIIASATAALPGTTMQAEEAAMHPWPQLSATSAARALIASLQHRHGPLMFHQAAAPWRDDPPLCFVRGDFPLVEQDVLLGEIDGTPFYVSHACHRRYGPTPVRLDALPGRAGVFSLERPTGLQFATIRQPAQGR